MASRKLGLEEARGEGKDQRVLSDSVVSSSSSELYVFVWHGVAVDYSYSLFSPGIPSPGTIVKTNTTTDTAVNGELVTSSISEITEPERSPITRVLRFPRNEEWPHCMRCIRLDLKLYFLGGKDVKGGFSTQVHVLDLSQEIPDDDDDDGARKVLKPVATTNTGVEFTQFEIFNPHSAARGGGGEWKEAEHQPPFPDTYHLSPPFVVDRAAYFGGKTIGGGLLGSPPAAIT